MTDKEQITCDCKYCMENPTCYKELLGKQLARKTQECEELKKYINEIGKNLGLNTDTGIIGPGALEHWAVVSTSINYAIKNLQQECEEHRSNAESYCKSYQYSCVVNGKITDKALKYKQALDEIAAHYQKVIKNITNYDDILDIINKAKGE